MRSQIIAASLLFLAAQPAIASAINALLSRQMSLPFGNEGALEECQGVCQNVLTAVEVSFLSPFL